MIPMIQDVIKQASSVSVGELNARTVGDAEATAAELASLVNAGVIQIKSDTNPPAGASTEELSGWLLEVLNSEQANDVFVQPTTLSFKLNAV